MHKKLFLDCIHSALIVVRQKRSGSCIPNLRLAIFLQVALIDLQPQLHPCGNSKAAFLELHAQLHYRHVFPGHEVYISATSAARHQWSVSNAAGVCQVAIMVVL